MIYGSLCSGIEAASVAWKPLGWQPAFFSEIEKFPSAVLAHHHPETPNHGDMTKFQEWPDYAIDLLVGGTPCQSFSVAGLRQGLADPRGNLMLTYGAVAARYRPKWVVWENVPGVLSSNRGRDFAAFLGLLGQLGYGWAYRVLDAQYVRVDRFPRAVPQRRRRVFVVGYFGDWRRAAAVLFERESLSGHPAPRREAGQGFARGFECGPQGGSLIDVGPTLDTRCKDGPIRNQLGAGVISQSAVQSNSGEVAYCLTVAGQQSLDAETETLLAVAHALRGEGFDASEDGTGRGTPIVPVAVAIQERAVCENPNAGPDGKGYRADGSAYTLEARTVPQAVAFDLNQITSPTNKSIPRGDVLHTMPARTCPPHLAAPWAVRRLTPTECESLQGFPDGYTDVPIGGRNHTPDGPRYKALGNSMAVNVMAWIGQRIEMVERMIK